MYHLTDIHTALSVCIEDKSDNCHIALRLLRLNMFDRHKLAQTSSLIFSSFWHQETSYASDLPAISSLFSVVNDQMEAKGIDRLLKVVGGFGRWQCFFLLLGTWSCIVAATNHVAIVFIGDSPKFRCFDQSHFNVSQACLDKNGNTCSEFIFDTTVYRSTLVTKWNLVCDRLIFLPLIQVTT